MAKEKEYVEVKIRIFKSEIDNLLGKKVKDYRAAARIIAEDLIDQSLSQLEYDSEDVQQILEICDEICDK